MKIIGVDNFNTELVSDILVCENVNVFFGELIVKLLNKHTPENSATFYKLVEDDYKLFKFNPNE
jgi:hypothetical protein